MSRYKTYIYSLIKKPMDRANIRFNKAKYKIHKLKDNLKVCQQVELRKMQSCKI